MNCEELQREISSYVDDALTPAARASCNAHLTRCPACRQRLIDTRTITRGLAHLARPEPPVDLASSIHHALAIEAAAVSSGELTLPAHEIVRRWLRPRLMPYTIGALTSVMLFACMFAAVLPYMRALRGLESGEATTFVRSDWTGPYDVRLPVSPEMYASSRFEFSAQSPSLNPKGALASLAWSRTREITSDDEMVVVADVFSDGNASLADVVMPPRNSRMLDDIQKAFRSSPAFVPASLDHRPQTMRVVLSIQRMDVTEQAF